MEKFYITKQTSGESTRNSSELYTEISRKLSQVSLLGNLAVYCVFTVVGRHGVLTMRVGVVSGGAGVTVDG